MCDAPGFRITTVTLFTSIDSDDQEGLCAFLTPTGWMPMVAADEDRVAELRKHAELIVGVTGNPVYMKQCTVIETIDVIVKHEDVE